MYYLFETHSVDWDEISPEKREWWWLVFKHSDKQTVLDWNYQYTRPYKRKLVQSSYTLKECFYPRKEIKTSSSTSKMLKAVGYK
jgi:hypothetical protein